MRVIKAEYKKLESTLRIYALEKPKSDTKIIIILSAVEDYGATAIGKNFDSEIDHSVTDRVHATTR
jgi:hypothetical protein